MDTSTFSSGIQAFYAASSASTSSRPMTKDDIEIQKAKSTSIDQYSGKDPLRKAYIEIFEEQNSYEHQNNSLWWKEQLVGIAQGLKAEMLHKYSQTMQPGILYPSPIIQEMKEMERISNEPESLSSLSSTFDIAINGRTSTFPWSETTVITVGRRQGCDIALNHVDIQKMLSLSRLHLLIFPIPEVRRFILVDVGSLTGFETIQRSVAVNPSYRLTSQPFGRQNLLTEKDEVVVLKLSNSTLVIHPKVCIVCLDQSRHAIFTTCNHYVCCESCASKLKCCPVCRAGGMNQNQELKVEVGDAAQSNAIAICLSPDRMTG
ncbi:MAG: forkhead associated FHA domain and RING domain protein [Sylvanvirus sp.]|uniref:Forkhead associated FHA domain and RING domain protein n=1 Tax=Sylvanvirus sp. TaxID=2487774 RepID=A0A3G5AI00_9VIRU|nr:MAG: forkhead associated FHA domain and RING domain protein [Sylvanvirus sp.]